ncbi:MAG: septal ring lytic transglycosylase RlpA family protein [Desulfobacterales bacterium]|uniref:Probable endolytic peptidoglycan transglycosylase RlpA n=1 Tax=Candidatus Desulfatibia profunda TaxID=2841695 RepID=A0A8J6NNP4_9BACT|nr:septal ring lytic transglycosylase RlpA family protein [Candidatus Desulfatibia profunda]MBL7179546.1 septal ring lytic transglycosylase RlpA family protein [Desulfobacterales bacterium]
MMTITSEKGRLPVIPCLIAVCGLLLLLVFGCATPGPPPTPPGHPKPYRIGTNWYQPLPHARDFRQRGKASWYGSDFHGRQTASGEIYDMYAMTAAHKTLPLGTYVRVNNLDNNKTIDVRVNDRGPFVRGRIIDLSYTAAQKIGVVGPGTAPVEIVALGTAAKTQGSAGISYVPVDFYKGNFTVQVGAFSDRENAEKLKLKLDKEYKNTHITTYNDGQETFYRVRVGRCSTLEQAGKYEEIMIQRGFEGAFAIAEDK